MPVCEASKKRVSLVTGFLGAGKSSLVNCILRQKEGRRVAVIENELGEVGIDSHLVSANLIAKEDIVNLERGCVCCSLRGDLVDALKELERREAASGTAFDAVLLETTGVADPGPVVFTFFANSYISSRYRLDSVMCLVDAQHISRLADERSPDALDEAVNQIAFADTILLNKVDLVSEDDLASARAIVRSVNMTAKIIECQLNEGGVIDIDGAKAEAANSGDGKKAAPAGGAATKRSGEAAPAAPVRPLPTWADLMDVNSFSIERALEVDPTFLDDKEEEGEEAAGADGVAAAADDAPRDGAPASTARPSSSAPAKRGRDAASDAAAGGAPPTSKPRAAGPGRRLHDLAGVSSVGISATGPLDQWRFNMFMKDLLTEKGRDIMRCKGVLCVKGQERVKFVFQGVHDTVCFGPSAVEWADDDARVSQVVFIGRDLDRATLADGLRSCVWTPLPPGWTEHRDARTGRPYYINGASCVKQWARPCDGASPPGDVAVTQASLPALTGSAATPTRGVAAGRA